MVVERIIKAVMSRPEPEKHTLYFEVLEAVRETKGCPLCHLEADRMLQHLDSLLYEFVNDPGYGWSLLVPEDSARDMPMRL